MELNSGLAIASGLTITSASIGGAFAQSKAAADKLFTPMIIALALIESLVIYAFVIAFLIKPTL